MKKFILTAVALASSLTFYAQNTFPSSGNVGIGTTNPSTNFEILAPGTSTSSIFRMSIDNAPEDFFSIGNATRLENQFIPLVRGFRTSDNREALILLGGILDDNDVGVNPIMIFDSRISGKTVVNRPLFEWRSYTEKKMLLDADGNLGIGTSNPDSKLTVKGSIHCEEVQVDLQVPADYVFEKYYTGESGLKKDYSMPTLTEVEAYTKENHHLPNIPSANEIKEEGLYLKDMTNLLLQKIEELTLYAIEQEKRINVLEGELAIEK